MYHSACFWAYAVHALMQLHIYGAAVMRAVDGLQHVLQRMLCPVQLYSQQQCDPSSGCGPGWLQWRVFHPGGLSQA
jgi:hypothetical protein